MKTLSQHISIFREFANSHEVIHSFGWGSTWENNASGNVYPQVFVEIVDSSVDQNTLTDTYRIFFSDYVRHDEINELEALSSMKSCALDLLAYLDKSLALGALSDISISHTLEPYTEAWDDRVSGWFLTLNIEQNYNYDYCNVPIGADSNTGSPCPPVIIYNADGSVNTSVAAGGSYTLASSADVTVTDNLASPTTIDVSPGGAYTCTLISTATCTQLNSESGGLTLAQRQLLQTIYACRSGQTVSYATGDDGDLENGRGASFSTLNCNNLFGNTNRFTDELGGQTYTNNLVVDHLTGLMWFITPFSADTWVNALTTVNASTQSGYSDWFLPNIKELDDISDFSLSSVFNYTPFNVSVALWSSTTRAVTTTQAWQSLTSGSDSPTNKTNTVQFIMCRKFAFSDL